ncbi:MAG: serine hydrolase [Planctomycetota bacterium]|nr:serine hydrolase [Planctomycetota bacterium]
MFASDADFLRALGEEPALSARGVIARARELRFQALVRWSGPEGAGEAAFRADAEYFYPSSTVKAAQALAACEKVSSLRAAGVSVTLDTAMVFGDEARPVTLHENLRRALIVSDNPAANRLLDLVGFDELHERAARWGLNSLNLRHALSEARTPVTATRRVALAGSDEVIAPARVGVLRKRVEMPGLMVGRGFARAGASGPSEIEPGAVDFGVKNRVSLSDLCTLMELIARPERFPPAQRPDVDSDSRAELLWAMSARPSECPAPTLETPAGGEDDLRPLARGLARDVPAGTRVIEKIGQAYGFTTSVAAVEVGQTLVSVAATIETNANGILNDDRYEYRELGEPAIRGVGEAVGLAARARLG